MLSILLKVKHDIFHSDVQMLTISIAVTETSNVLCSIFYCECGCTPGTSSQADTLSLKAALYSNHMGLFIVMVFLVFAKCIIMKNN